MDAWNWKKTMSKKVVKATKVVRKYTAEELDDLRQLSELVESSVGHLAHIAGWPEVVSYMEQILELARDMEKKRTIKMNPETSPGSLLS